MPQIILSHSGKQHSYQVARALNNLGMLDSFYTSSYIRNKAIQNIITWTNNSYWSRRFIDGLAGSKIKSNWRFELPEIMLRCINTKPSKIQQAVYKRDEVFDSYIASKINKRSFPDPENTFFWGFQGSCLQSLKSAENKGIRSIYEQSSVYIEEINKIFSEEKKLLPEWAHSIPTLDYDKKYYERLKSEPFHADQIVVNSSYSSTTLVQAGIPKEKINLVPLGVDLSKIPLNKTQKKTDNFLYVGRISQSKGIYYMLEAFNKLPKGSATLTLIGNNQTHTNLLKKYNHFLKTLPPLNQNELLKKYSEYDCLILPTILDGFGLVIVEAMAAGLPVITTPHSIGPELITDGENGYIVPIRDVEALKEAILKIRNLETSEYLTMRNNARLSALDFSWTAYEQRLQQFLSKIM